MEKLKAVLYINQFFGQIGGEDKADYPPEIRVGLVGPASVYKNCLGDRVEISHTVICGDNYMGSNTEKAMDQILKLLSGIKFDVFFAGPAFMAGRYGIACGNICKKINEKFNVPVFTSMNEENPGVEMFRRDMYIFKGYESARAMRGDIERVCKYALKYLNGEELLSANEEGYFGRGIRKTVFTDKSVADRAVDMLLAKLNNEPFETEIPIWVNEIPKPAEAVKDLSKAKIALISTGGIIPANNPDRIQSSSATIWGKYNIDGMKRLNEGEFICIHSGFDNFLANQNPNIVAPLDVLREIEETGAFGELHSYFYTTTGTGTAQGVAARMAREIADDLIKANVDGVIFTST